MPHIGGSVGRARPPSLRSRRGGTTIPAHVLRLITRLNIGGPARQALLLTRELADDFPTLLVAGTPPPEEGELEDPAVREHRLPLVRSIRPLTDLRAVSQTRRLLQAHGTRIVHTHMAKAGTVGRLAAATVRPRPRTVHTFHGHVLEGYFAPAVERVFIEVERRLARHTDVLVAVSAEIRDQLLELRIGRPEQYRVIPLGLELDTLLDTPREGGTFRAELGLEPDEPLVGVVGRLAPIKDHHTLLRAMVSLPDVHLAIVGDGEMRADLESVARQLGIERRVHFTGWRHDLPNVFRDIDLAVLTSRNEGTPVSLIEAHAAGVAAVATDVGGVSAVVQEGITGTLVPAGEASAVAGAVSALLDDPLRLQRFGEQARQHVRDRFGYRRLVEDISRLYTELTGG